MSAPRLRGDEATAHTADIPSKNCSAVSSADVLATAAQARAAAQLPRLPVSLGYSFRPLLRGRGGRSAPSLPARSPHTQAGSQERPLLGCLDPKNPAK